MSKFESGLNLPKRAKRFGVGKEIGGNVYVHERYEHLLGNVVQMAKQHVPRDFRYTVVKLNLQTYAVTFISSPDFDSADEPIVGSQVLVRGDGTIRLSKQLDDPYIYHHKWLMVRDDYSGFDVEASKLRSRTWLALENIDKSRIGRRSFWERTVVSRLDVTGG